LPEKNLCFDCAKPDTSIGQLLEAHVEKRVNSPLSALIDEYYYGVRRGNSPGWSVDDKTPLRPKYGNSKELILSAIRNPDTVLSWHGHIWKFTPSTFKSIYQELLFLEVVTLKLENILPTETMEFVVHLSS
jgi:hypothetical protein